MSGVSASTLVLFIASVLVAAGVAGTLVATVGDITRSAETRGEAVSSSIDTDIQILNDGTGSAFYREDGIEDGEAKLTLYVRNTGSTTLSREPNAITVLVNGRLIRAENLRVTSVENGDESVWTEGEVIEIVVTLETALSEGGNRVTVSVDGDERSIEFRGDS